MYASCHLIKFSGKFDNVFSLFLSSLAVREVSDRVHITSCSNTRRFMVVLLMRSIVEKLDSHKYMET